MTISTTQHVIELASGPLLTEYGEFQIKVFTDGLEQGMVAIKGDVKNVEAVPCRLHSECICSHVLYSRECDCSNQMREALHYINSVGVGIVILLTQEGRSNGSVAHIATQTLKRSGISQDDAYKLVGFPVDGRDYRFAAKILKALNVNSISLLSSSERKKKMLEIHDIIVELYDLRMENTTILGSYARNLVSYTKLGDYVELASNRHPKVLIFGDLAVDIVVHRTNDSDEIIDTPSPNVGGTGLNAALAFKQKPPLFPILCGRIGNDTNGKIVRKELEHHQITSLLAVDQSRRTAVCTSVFNINGTYRLLIKDEDNISNIYEIDDFEQSLELSKLSDRDYVFLACHFFVRRGLTHSRLLIRQIVKMTNAAIICDLVPHDMYKDDRIDRKGFLDVVNEGVHVVIAELTTILRLLGYEYYADDINGCTSYLKDLTVRYVVVRYGVGNIEYQSVLYREMDGYRVVSTVNTCYSKLKPDQRRGFGDLLTADLLSWFSSNPEIRWCPSLT
ncbi:MAG: PfkB family carbohydrate kinase [Magnetococcus sp. DMHC-1]